MLIFEHSEIGNKLFYFRKKLGLTQAEVAEAADLSTRTYANIERGNANMRIETILKICKVLNITPDDVLTQNDNKASINQQDVLNKLNNCSTKNKETALKILSAYLDSL